MIAGTGMKYLLKRVTEFASVEEDDIVEKCSAPKTAFNDDESIPVINEDLQLPHALKRKLLTIDEDKKKEITASDVIYFGSEVVKSAADVAIENLTPLINEACIAGEAKACELSDQLIQITVHTKTTVVEPFLEDAKIAALVKAEEVFGDACVKSSVKSAAAARKACVPFMKVGREFTDNLIKSAAETGKAVQPILAKEAGMLFDETLKAAARTGKVVRPVIVKEAEVLYGHATKAAAETRHILKPILEKLIHDTRIAALREARAFYENAIILAAETRKVVEPKLANLPAETMLHARKAATELSEYITMLSYNSKKYMDRLYREIMDADAGMEQ